MVSLRMRNSLKKIIPFHGYFVSLLSFYAVMYITIVIVASLNRIKDTEKERRKMYHD